MATTIAADSAPAGEERFLSLSFNRMPFDTVLAWVAARDADSPFAYVVTPNVDHMVRLESGTEPVRRAYEDADLCICDSRVLSRLARLCGIDLPVVPGSDLTKALLAGVFRPGDRLCLIGGTPAIAEALGKLYPGLEIVQHSPPMGLLHDPAGRQAAIAFAAKARARAVLLAVGAPQQEVLAWEMQASGRVSGTGLCIGASIDFLIGAQSRAPAIVRRAGFEWAWRLMTEPRRLWRRYLIDGPAIFPIVWRWARSRHRSRR